MVGCDIGRAIKYVMACAIQAIAQDERLDKRLHFMGVTKGLHLTIW